MNKPIKIYLGDLTYNTVALSTDVFPLNVGYIASYCIDKFGKDVEVKLFKYIEELDAEINNSPPDIIGLSNYCWNHKVSLELFHIAKEKNPNVITVWGGPNFPLELPTQEQFMKKNVDADVYVPVEGEVGFSNLVECALGAKSKEDMINHIRLKPIEGCVTRNLENKLQYLIPVTRLKNLDEIPSPYLNGLMDKFFDGKLVPMMQTNRGCPFTCTFCTDGQDQVMKVNYFSIERVKNELEYMGKNIPKTTHEMEISDLNFGMYERDLEICHKISEIQQKYNWPKRIIASTGKNKKERVIESIRILNGAMNLTMSVQSLDDQVLKNIKRDNISVDTMLSLAPSIRSSELRTYSEIILGLPGETYQSHINTIKELVASGIDFVKGYTLMLLMGSELEIPKEREKWGFKTKFRVLTMDFAKLSNGKKIIETEEVVVGSNSLSFEEFLELRLLAFAMWITSKDGAFDPLRKFLRQNNIDIFQLYYNQVKNLENATEKVKEIFSMFKQATLDELWDSPEQIEINYQKDEEYEKLLKGEIGMNLLNHFSAQVTVEYLEDLVEYVMGIALNLLNEKSCFTTELNEQFYDVVNYCKGTTFNVLGDDRLTTNPEYEFNFDVKRWFEAKNNENLSKFKLSKTMKYSFVFTEQQYKVVQNCLDNHENTTVGRGTALKTIPQNLLWRKINN